MRLPRLPFSPKKKKKTRKKDVANWQSWEKETLDRKFRILAIVGGVLAIPILIFMGIRLQRAISERQQTAEHRPVILNSNAPTLLAPFTCDLRTGAHFGDVQSFFRNQGNALAVNLAPSLTLRMVPERKVGDPQFDEIPSGDCNTRSRKTLRDKLAAGVSYNFRWKSPTVSLPPLLNGETVQLYAVSCVQYEDESGVAHSACDTYRFRPSSGIPAFACDEMPKMGKFDAERVSGCAQ